MTIVIILTINYHLIFLLEKSGPQFASRSKTKHQSPQNARRQNASPSSKRRILEKKGAAGEIERRNEVE